mmetsp:Transcript_30954/g.45399  ORF Transcript_30954/g.45399 Transcript_30954/m.45399 type:complete len:235 (+) Transcript_30954:289-993(+)
MACGTRPSMITAASAPASTAATAVISLGIMPPVMVPSAFSPATWSSWISRMSFLSLSSTPVTSVSSSSREAPSAPAIAPAEVSALMFSVCPCGVTPTGAITGMSPAAITSSISFTLIVTGSPTKPRSRAVLRPVLGSVTTFSSFSARIRWSSLPESPSARPPARLILDTISLFMDPESTISAIRTVSSSVTRNPSTNVLSMFSFFSISAIWGPPPCTTTGFTPHCFKSTISFAK